MAGPAGKAAAMLGLITREGIAEVDGNYPSKGGIGERAAWFRDSEGNLLAIGQPVSRR